MMNCKDVKIFLYSFLDGELDEKERFEFETHLENCESCRNSYEFEFEFQNRIKESLKKEQLTIKAPSELKEMIRERGRGSYHFNFDFNKNISAIAAILFAVFFISPSFVGYTTLTDENIDDYSKKIENYSSSEKDIKKWIKSHSLHSPDFLNIDRKKIKITPIGFSIRKKKPIFYYHYRGKKLLHKRVLKKLNESNLTTIIGKRRKIFVKKSKGLYNLYWYNDKMLNSLTGNLTLKDVRIIVASIK